MADANDAAKRITEWTTEELTAELDLRRRETDSLWHDLDKKDSGLTDLIRRSIDACRPAADQARVTLNFKPPETDFEVNIDVAKIEKVIGRLLSNAARFSPENSTISISCEAAGLSVGRRDSDGTVPAVALSVSDESEDFPVADIDELFGRFVQSYKDRGASDESDFGLALCKDVVEGHRGRIWANQKLMGGLVFGFSLPLNS